VLTDDQNTHAISYFSKECLFCVVLTPLKTLVEYYKAVSQVLSCAHIQRLVFSHSFSRNQSRISWFLKVCLSMSRYNHSLSPSTLRLNDHFLTN